MTEVEILPVGLDQLTAIGSLFGQSRQTRHCWCTAFCSTSWQFAAGWYGGGNRRRFQSLARTESQPMGMLAIQQGEPVGWCACGPRSRYTAALAGRSSLLTGLSRAEDECVWLIACILIRPGRHGADLIGPLIGGALALARNRGAVAVEAWPLAHGAQSVAEAHVGREGVFARFGFDAVQRPSSRRTIMRLDLQEQ